MPEKMCFSMHLNRSLKMGFCEVQKKSEIRVLLSLYPGLELRIWKGKAIFKKGTLDFEGHFG